MTISINNLLQQRQEKLNVAINQLIRDSELLESVANTLIQSLCSNKKILICGNGGSAAQAQHMAGELIGRFKKNRAPIAALALGTDMATTTAIANDFGYEEVFLRQVDALGNEGDVLLILSTSGNSPNVLAAVNTARRKGLKTVAFTGKKPSKVEELADIIVRFPAEETDVIQELHLLAIHILCEVVEEHLSKGMVDGQ